MERLAQRAEQPRSEKPWRPVAGRPHRASQGQQHWESQEKEGCRPTSHSRQPHPRSAARNNRGQKNHGGRLHDGRTGPHKASSNHFASLAKGQEIPAGQLRHHLSLPLALVGAVSPRLTTNTSLSPVAPGPWPVVTGLTGLGTMASTGRSCSRSTLDRFGRYMFHLSAKTGRRGMDGCRRPVYLPRVRRFPKRAPPPLSATSGRSGWDGSSKGLAA